MKNKTEIDINNLSHIDIANQINNKWERDSILALVDEEKKIYYSIRFKNCDKSKIKNNYINANKTQSAKRHNSKVVNLIFAYLIFKILEKNKERIKRVYICPDHRPSREVHHFIQKISYELGIHNLTQQININFAGKDGFTIKKKTPAHRLANKILKGKKKANDYVNFDELNKIIAKIL